MDQQGTWKEYLAERQQALQQQTLQALHALQPWNYGLGRMPNPLLSRAAVPALSEGDPQAGILPYFMGNDPGAGGTMNPMLMQMLMGGSGGAL